MVQVAGVLKICCSQGCRSMEWLKQELCLGKKKGGYGLLTNCAFLGISYSRASSLKESISPCS